jgi:two-component system, NarL family, sensor histidine kinase DevS
MRALVEAGIALSSELSLDSVLQKIVEAAALLTGARYAALGVINEDRNGLERFVYTGLDEETRERIGDLPRGRGILGVLIQEARPLRLRDLSQDTRSVGFPEHHPEMRTFLGVPIALRGIAYGNLYLTEKEGGGDFTEDDEELVNLLASQAAVAVENARLYESATLWSRQLESLHEVVGPLGAETDLRALLSLIAARLRELIDARIVLIALPAREGDLSVEAADGEGAADFVGHRLPRAGTKSGRVLERRQSARVDSVVDDPEVDQEEVRRLGAHSGLYVPLVVANRSIGIVAAHDKHGSDPRFSDADLRLAEIFAARAAVAVDLSQRVARDALRRVVEAQELERRRLARELHDETGQALTSTLLGLKAIEEARSEEEMRAAAATLRELVVATLQDVRNLAVELRPKALDDFGLVPALERLAQSFAEQTGIGVDFEAGGLGKERLPGDVETALYRIVQECLTNVVKHSHARRVSILLTRRDHAVAAVVEDDGQGFEPGRVPDEGVGLLGMRERIALLDGRLEVESQPGSGTTLLVEVPLA